MSQEGYPLGLRAIAPGKQRIQSPDWLAVKVKTLINTTEGSAPRPSLEVCPGIYLEGFKEMGLCFSGWLSNSAESDIPARGSHPGKNPVLGMRQQATPEEREGTKFRFHSRPWTSR